jgi:spore maturation protein CgeB
VVYANSREAALRHVEQARGADLIVKASGVGVFDELLEAAVLELKSEHTLVAFWDVDAPATLERVWENSRDPFRTLIPHYDFIFTYGGGPPVVDDYRELGAQECVPIYNALDPSTHFPTAPDPRFAADLSFLGNRLPDRESRVHAYFFETARALPSHRFILGGNGWGDRDLPPNIHYAGHVYTKDHNTFNCSARMVLNISRASMARYGFSPATRVFEAAGSGTCLISDDWDGIAEFFEPGREILVAETTEAVGEFMKSVDPSQIQKIGRAAYKRVLAQHTYAQRAIEVEQALEGAAV